MIGPRSPAPDDRADLNSGCLRRHFRFCMSEQGAVLHETRGLAELPLGRSLFDQP
jgi:hypothetical protein